MSEPLLVCPEYYEMVDGQPCVIARYEVGGYYWLPVWMEATWIPAGHWWCAMRATAGYWFVHANSDAEAWEAMIYAAAMIPPRGDDDA